MQAAIERVEGVEWDTFGPGEEAEKDRPGASGKPIQSIVTDNESAKMKTSHGMIRGYISVVAVDSQHQVVVHAEAHGHPQEHELFKPTIEGIRQVLNPEPSKKSSALN